MAGRKAAMPSAAARSGAHARSRVMATCTDRSLAAKREESVASTVAIVRWRRGQSQVSPVRSVDRPDATLQALRGFAYHRPCRVPETARTHVGEEDVHGR